jgi:branched-subunit amino acid aminotransferase/4-amino-4-deoxychorismate lyase
LDALRHADGVFVSLSSSGIVEAVSLDGGLLRRSPLTQKIRHAYFELLQRESRVEPQKISI